MCNVLCEVYVALDYCKECMLMVSVAWPLLTFRIIIRVTRFLFCFFASQCRHELAYMSIFVFVYVCLYARMYVFTYL